MRLTPSREESSCSEGISWPGFIITVKRRLRAMSFYQYLLSMVLAIYVGFSRLHHLRYVARDPILTCIAETREYIWGELRNGDRPSGPQIARHLKAVLGAVPPGVERRLARADSGFYCWDAVQAYEEGKVEFIVVARKTPRLLEKLR